MKGSKKARANAFRKGRNKAAMLLILFVFVLLCILLYGKSRQLRALIRENSEVREELELRIEEEEARTEEIRRIEEEMQTDDFIRRVARDKLGLVEDNDIVFRKTDP